MNKQTEIHAKHFHQLHKCESAFYSRDSKGRFTGCRIESNCEDFVFAGGKFGKHRITKFSSLERLRAHWRGYVENQENAK